MRIRFFSAVWLRSFVASLMIGYLATSVATAAPASAVDADRMQLRKDYAAAQKALKENRLQAYKQLLPKLQDYPLLPYLEYDDITRRLNSLPTADVEKFFE